MNNLLGNTKNSNSGWTPQISEGNKFSHLLKELLTLYNELEFRIYEISVLDGKALRLNFANFNRKWLFGKQKWYKY